MYEEDGGEVKHTAEAHGEVGASPEEVGHAAAGGEVAVEPVDVGDGLFATDVSQGALVRVVERLDILDAAELPLKALNLAGRLGAVAGVEVEGAAEVVDAGLEVLRLGHVVEQAAEEAALLGGDLGGGGVASNGAVTDGPDVAGTLDDKVLVDSEATARVGLGGDARDEVLDDGADSVAGGPDEEAVGDDDALAGAVGLGDLGLDGGLGDLLDHGLGLDVNLLLAEGVLGVVNQLLGEGGQDVGQGLDQGDLEAGADLGDQLLDVLLEKVLQLAGKLDAGRATADDNHVHQAVDLFRALALEGGRLDAVHNLLADALGVANLLEERAVLLDAGDAKGGVLGTNADNEHVVGDLGLHGLALDFGVVDNGDYLAVGVNGRGVGFVVLDGALLVADNGADGLHDGAVLDGAGGARGQQGREEEVVARRDDNDVVVFGIDLLEQGDGAPAGACAGKRRTG